MLDQEIEEITAELRDKRARNNTEPGRLLVDLNRELASQATPEAVGNKENEAPGRVGWGPGGPGDQAPGVVAVQVEDLDTIEALEDVLFGVFARRGSTWGAPARNSIQDCREDLTISTITGAPP